MFRYNHHYQGAHYSSLLKLQLLIYCLIDYFNNSNFIKLE
jgi:hypothetical protein